MCSRQVCVIAGASSEWLEIKKGTGPSSFISCVSNSRLEVVANTRLSFNICNCQCLREENWRIRSKSPRRIAVSCFLSRQKLTVDFLPPPPSVTGTMALCPTEIEVDGKVDLPSTRGPKPTVLSPVRCTSSTRRKPARY